MTTQFVEASSSPIVNTMAVSAPAKRDNTIIGSFAKPATHEKVVLYSYMSISFCSRNRVKETSCKETSANFSRHARKYLKGNFIFLFLY